MIHWLYDRCERRLQKAVTKQAPTKTNQHLARQGILSDMLAALDVATAKTRGHIQQVLEDITDLSSDEDSPTMNTGGHDIALNTGGHDIALNSGVPTDIATAFVHGVAGMGLCGCDIGDLETSNINMIPFTILVLTAWSLALGGCTWYWLRQPVRPVVFPPTTLATHETEPEPQVSEDLQIEGNLLVALRRIHGRLERAQRRGNIGQGMKHMQNRTWLLSCVAHYTSCSPQERLRMAEVIADTCNLSEDDESPQHRLGEDEKHLQLAEADKAFRAIMALLEYDKFEEVTKLIGQLGGALREVKPESSKSDEEMAEETPAEKAQRYMNCGQSEVSDPDFWADVRYGPRSHREETEPDDGTGLQEF